MEDREQSFAAFVIETLACREVELARRWSEEAELVAAADAGEPSDDGGEPTYSAQDVVRAVLVAARDEGGGQSTDVVTRNGRAVGLGAFRQCISLRQMLGELDLLQEVLLQAAERAAVAADGDGASRGGALTTARYLCAALSALRVAATSAYANAVEEDLHERYRAIRHDLRNALGTIRSAVALLTDESVPPELRETSRMHAMVVRSTSLLGRMITDALGDDAALPPVFRRRGGASARKQRDDFVRSRQRPDLESGAL